MPEHDVRWSQYPKVAEDPTARAWLTMQAGRNLAKHTVETYGRSMEDFLRFTAREGIRLEQATREHLAAYVRDCWADEPAPTEGCVISSPAPDLSNATVLLRLSVVRLFYDHLVLDGLRPTNPVGRMHWRRRYGHWPGDAPLVRRHRKLPWIPTEEQWQAILAAMQHESPRNRADVCAVVRRRPAPAGNRPSQRRRSGSRAPIGARPGREREERLRAHRTVCGADRAAPGCVPRSSASK